MEIPSIRSYGEYSSDNYGANSLSVQFEDFTLYYSYSTIVAFRDRQEGLIVHKNDWGTTTGKHLNWIDGGCKRTRLPHEEFQKKLQAMLERHTK